MVIELLTGLHAVTARELADDCTPDELPELIRRYHDADGDTVQRTVVRNLKDMRREVQREAQKPSHKTRPKCKWPRPVLDELSAIAAQLVRSQARRRAFVSDIVPDLEDLMQTHAPEYAKTYAMAQARQNLGLDTIIRAREMQSNRGRRAAQPPHPRSASSQTSTSVSSIGVFASSSQVGSNASSTPSQRAMYSTHNSDDMEEQSNEVREVLRRERQNNQK